MAKTRKAWVLSPAKPPAVTVPASVKAAVQQQMDELVETVLKPKYIQPPPAPTLYQGNYITDIYTKTYRHYFYCCAKYCAGHPEALAPFFEAKFARLEYVGSTRFNLAFMRHTQQWAEVYRDLTLDKSLEAIRDDPFFEP